MAREITPPSDDMEMTPEVNTEATSKISGTIDHTLLKPEATRDEILALCEQAKKYQFKTVCVNSVWIAEVAEALKDSPTLPIAVVGFPLGASTSATKAFETREAIRLGAQEIDMVLDIGGLKSRDFHRVKSDIATVVQAAAPHPVKVILETALLTQEEKIEACRLSQEAGAAFVKTSTGFSKGGATEADITLMRKTVGPTLGVKASGGIRTYSDWKKMIAAGANRVGASASVAIVEEAAGDSPVPTSSLDIGLASGPASTRSPQTPDNY